MVGYFLNIIVNIYVLLKILILYISVSNGWKFLPISWFHSEVRIGELIH
jgi:hypothetical protein